MRLTPTDHAGDIAGMVFKSQTIFLIMCIRCQEIAGITVGTIMKRRGAPFTSEQETLLENVEWNSALTTFQEPESLKDFLDSLDSRQLGEWANSMQECKQSLILKEGRA